MVNETILMNKSIIFILVEKPYITLMLLSYLEEHEQMPIKEINIRTLRMLKALDNPLRIKIVEYILNSSPVAFSEIDSHLEEESGREINNGTLAYHLDILAQSNVITRELGRGPGRTYSRYNISEEVIEELRKLDLIVETT